MQWHIENGQLRPVIPLLRVTCMLMLELQSRLVSIRDLEKKSLRFNVHPFLPHHLGRLSKAWCRCTIAGRLRGTFQGSKDLVFQHVKNIEKWWWKNMNSTCSSYFDHFWTRIWHPDSLRTITLTCSLAFIMNYLFYGTTFATGQQLSGIDEERNKTCRILGQSNICDDSSLVFLYSVLHAHLKGVHVKTCARTGTEQTIYIYL